MLSLLRVTDLRVRREQFDSKMNTAIDIRSADHRNFPERSDAIFGLTLIIIVAAVFSAGASTRGFYSDDGSFLFFLPKMGFVDTLRNACIYVTGRNLHIIWQRIIYFIVGSGPEALPTMHLVQSSFIALNALIFYAFLRNLSVASVVAFAATALFTLYPNHAETSFWLSSGPMNLMSTMFVLLYLLTSLQLAKGLSRSTPKKMILLALADFVIFLCALFTYDQVVFVLAAILSLKCLYVFVSLPRFRSATTVCFLAHLSVFGVLVWLKVHNPSGGPVLSYANLPHISANLNRALSYSFGAGFQDLIHSSIGPHIEPGDINKAAWLAALMVCAAVATIFLKQRAPHRISFKAEIAVALGGAGFFFLAYLPSLMWFIAPRHNYLPSVGTAMVFGALLSIFVNAFRSHAVIQKCAVLGVIIGSAWLSFHFITYNLVEGRSFATSYQRRKNLYEDLASKGLLKDKKLLVLEGFPATTGLGSAPFVGQEQVAGVNYLLREKGVELEHLSIYAFPSKKGVFAFVETNRWGAEAFRHYYGDKVRMVFFKGFAGDKVEYTLRDPSFTTDRSYRFTEQQIPKQQPSEPIASTPANGTALPLLTAVERLENGSPALRLRLHFAAAASATLPKRLGTDRLVAVLWGDKGPLTISNIYGEPITVPIDLSSLKRSAADSEPVFILSVKLPLMGKLEAVRLYQVNEHRPTLMQTIDISRPGNAPT